MTNNNSYIDFYFEDFKKSLDEYDVDYIDGSEKHSAILNLKLKNIGDLKVFTIFHPVQFDNTELCGMFDLYFQIASFDNPTYSALEMCNTINKEYKSFNVYLDNKGIMWCHATLFVTLSNCAELSRFILFKSALTIDEYYPQIMKLCWGI